MSYRPYQKIVRRKSRRVHVGRVPVGDGAPITVQTMTNTLTTGNAGGTDLVVDGVPSASLGGNGVVRRDLPLDPDLIKDGRLATANPRPATQ